MQQMLNFDFSTGYPQKNAYCGKLVHKFVEKFTPEPLDRNLLAVVNWDCEKQNIAPCYDGVGLPGSEMIIGAGEPSSVFLAPFPLDEERSMSTPTQPAIRERLTTTVQRTYTDHV